MITKKEQINSFRGYYEFLSNFYTCEITYKGNKYLNSEAAFQAQKCMTEEEKQQFCELPAVRSKKLGRKIKMRPDWDDIKTGIMEEIVRAKFIQNPQLAYKLLETGDAELVEGNSWGDTFWGVDTKTGNGENNLGKILMKIREEISSKYANF